MEYPAQLREQIMKQVMTTNTTQAALAEEYGIGRSTLQKWLRDSRKSGGLPVTKNQEKRPQDWRDQERFAALLETSGLGEEELGTWCRRHGLHSHHLEKWKQDAIAGTGGKAPAQDKVEARKLREENRHLRKELRRKDQALAETSALLVLKKKAHLIWGENEDD